jgi:CheY-like chemotaxis protein
MTVIAVIHVPIEVSLARIRILGQITTIPKRFDLVLTDEMMPDLTGTELAYEIRQLRPEISIILMSGYGGAKLSERARAAGVIDVLRKPLIRPDIAEPVARALQAGNYPASDGAR